MNSLRSIGLKCCNIINNCRPQPLRLSLVPCWHDSRWLSNENESTVIPTVGFSQLNNELKSNKIILIDVREKDELTTDGKISESKHIPLGEIIQAFELNNENFRLLYGFDKPRLEDNIIIHCKMGIRAMKAAVALNKTGYESIRVYPGIKDWIENNGALQK